MNGTSRWQRVNSSAGSERPVRYGVGFSIACLALYILVMAGVRFYAHSIGVVGGLLTVAGMYGAARWYERRQKKVEILPEERIDDRLR